MGDRIGYKADKWGLSQLFNVVYNLPEPGFETTDRLLTSGVPITY